MDRFIPTQEAGRMTDEEWGMAIEAQFENTIPATKRRDLLQKWVQDYVGQFSFDETEAHQTQGMTWIHPDYLEEKLPEGMRVAYAAMKSRLAYLFEKYYGIVFSNEDVDFSTMYHCYLFFVKHSTRTMAKYLRAYYENYIRSTISTPPPAYDYFKSLIEAENKKDPSILSENSTDTSVEYASVALLLNAITMENYVETVQLASDGSEIDRIVADKVLDLLEITFDSDDLNRFPNRLYNEIQDPEVVGAILRQLETV